jgi:UDP-N-acetylglucosamine--N-acetylmuramyl-(pentapeptide) pyrophosphoryl-undecaprenol N-acetylglucosamine transferase
MRKTKKILISGGGTGGHIFPALAIAQALQRIDPSIEILFVGAKGKIEETKVPEAGYNIELIDIRGFQRRLTFDNLINIFRLIKSNSKARKILRDFKPDVVVGVGGYASGPVVYTAAKRKIPTLIQEQNSYPGITNKILAKRADKICTAYHDMERFFPKEKIILTGNPVRKKITDTDASKDEVLSFFELKPDKKVILSLGGSGGARSINEGIKAGLKSIIDADVHLIWQTGAKYFEDAQKSVESIQSDHIKVYDFISRMDLAYKASDVVISRAGAGTISELCLLEKASILVPSPNVAEDHQTKNAMALVKLDAAVLVKDNETNEKLVPEALDLLYNKEKSSSLSKNIAKEKVVDSDMIIAREVLKLIKE